MRGSKAASYLGFARRAGKLTLGVNAVETVKSCYLLVADESLTQNSRKKIEKMRERLNCPLVYCDGLGDMVGRPGCKLAAVRDENLAKATEAAIGAKESEE